MLSESNRKSDKWVSRWRTQISVLLGVVGVNCQGHAEGAEWEHPNRKAWLTASPGLAEAREEEPPISSGHLQFVSLQWAEVDPRLPQGSFTQHCRRRGQGSG